MGGVITLLLTSFCLFCLYLLVRAFLLCGFGAGLGIPQKEDLCRMQ